MAVRRLPSAAARTLATTLWAERRPAGPAVLRAGAVAVALDAPHSPAALAPNGARRAPAYG